MSQADTLTVPDGSGQTWLDKGNALIGALNSDWSGPSAPPQTEAYMRWLDTLSNSLKRRNATNDGWEVIWVRGKTANPTVNDDTTFGFVPGAVWAKTNQVYICQDATQGAAVWQTFGGGGGTWGSITGSIGSQTDLQEALDDKRSVQDNIPAAEVDQAGDLNFVTGAEKTNISTSATAVSGATSAATASTIAKRDANGRMKAAAGVDSDDVAVVSQLGGGSGTPTDGVYVPMKVFGTTADRTIADDSTWQTVTLDTTLKTLGGDDTTITLSSGAINFAEAGEYLVEVYATVKSTGAATSQKAPVTMHIATDESGSMAAIGHSELEWKTEGDGAATALYNATPTVRAVVTTTTANKKAEFRATIPSGGGWYDVTFTSTRLAVWVSRLVSAAGGGGGGTPGGSSSHVQYNASGSFGGSSAFTFDATNGRVVAANVAGKHADKGAVSGSWAPPIGGSEVQTLEVDVSADLQVLLPSGAAPPANTEWFVHVLLNNTGTGVVTLDYSAYTIQGFSGPPRGIVPGATGELWLAYRGGVWRVVGHGGIPYSPAFFLDAIPTSAILMNDYRHNPTRVPFKPGDEGTVRCLTAPTADTYITVQRVLAGQTAGNDHYRAKFSSGNTFSNWEHWNGSAWGSPVAGSAVTFAHGDSYRVISPANLNGMAGLSWVMKCMEQEWQG